MNEQIARQLLSVLRLGAPSQHPASTEAPVSWSTEDVYGLASLLEFEGAQVWFYRHLQRGRATVPAEFKSALRDSVHRVSVVNMRIDAQTVAVTKLLDAGGVRWSLLKGQARRAAAALYPYADARTVSDVDLLVPEAQADEAWKLLVANGFRRVIEGPVNWTADHHLPTLIDANNVAVELHTTTSMSVSPGEAWRRATERSTPVQWSGLNTSVPNATELVWQALSHGVADGHTGFVLKGFLSVAAILNAQPDIDWSAIEQRIARRETLDNESHAPAKARRVQQYLSVSAWLANYTLPPALQTSAAVDLTRVLRWRARILGAAYGRATRERFLEEGGRVEARQHITPLVPQAGVLRNSRRRLASIAARLGYRAWRRSA